MIQRKGVESSQPRTYYDDETNGTTTNKGLWIIASPGVWTSCLNWHACQLVPQIKQSRALETP